MFIHCIYQYFSLIFYSKIAQPAEKQVNFRPANKMGAKNKPKNKVDSNAAHHNTHSKPVLNVLLLILYF